MIGAAEAELAMMDGPLDHSRFDSAPMTEDQDVVSSSSESPALAEIPNIGRRSAPRLRLSLPATLTAVERSHRCVLMNISRTGAQIALLQPLREGEGAVLKCNVVDRFVIVTRTEFSVNALAFEEPISHEDVLAIRSYHENFEERERRQLIDTARSWVSGNDPDERAL